MDGDDETTTLETTNPTTAPATPPPAEPTVTTPADGAPPADGAAGARGQVLQGAALAERLARQKKALLVEEYGSDDPVKIEAVKAQRKKDADEVARFRRLEEARKRSRMTQTERQSLETQAAIKRAEAAEKALQEHKRGFAVRQQEQTVAAVIEQHVAPEYAEYARVDFAKAYNALTPEKKAALKKPEKAKAFLEKFMVDFVKAKPVFAKAKDAPTETDDKKPPAAPAAKPPERRVLQGTRPPAPAVGTPAKGKSYEGKDPRPGKPNSMSRKELAEYCKDNNINYPM